MNERPTNGEWLLQAERALTNGDVLRCRRRATHSGIFDEAVTHLIWDRAMGARLTYQVSRGHAGYVEVRIQLREDEGAAWLEGRTRDNAAWRAFASLAFATGEFHDEGDFRLPRPETAWAVVREDNGVLIEKQLTWTKERHSGVERLFDSQYRLVWSRPGKDDAWTRQSGAPPSVTFPAPDMPYRMTKPTWLP